VLFPATSLGSGAYSSRANRVARDSYVEPLSRFLMLVHPDLVGRSMGTGIPDSGIQVTHRRCAGSCVVRSKQSPVEGLKPEQFAVFEDGKPQKIATVELIKTGAKVQRRAAPGEFSNELNASGPARLTIIGIDTINTPFLDQNFARQQVLKYIANSLDTGDQVAILGVYRDGSVRMLHDITGDPATLVAAIKATTGALPNSAADSKTTPTYSKLETQRAMMAGNKSPNLGTGDPELSRAVDEAQALQTFQESTSGAGGFELRRNMEATLESMHQIGEAYSAVPGRKSFIWITGSFPFDISGTAELMAPKTNFYGVIQDTGRYQSEHSGGFRQSRQYPAEHFLMGFQRNKPTRARDRRVVSRHLLPTQSQKLPQPQRICRPPCNPALGVDPFEVADQQQPKVNPGCQRRPSHRRGVKLFARTFRKPIEPVLLQYPVHLLIKRMPGCTRQLRAHDPERFLLFVPSILSAHCHACIVGTEPVDSSALSRDVSRLSPRTAWD
jgi:VWFA-related protein